MSVTLREPLFPTPPPHLSPPFPSLPTLLYLFPSPRRSSPLVFVQYRLHALLGCMFIFFSGCKPYRPPLHTHKHGRQSLKRDTEINPHAPTLRDKHAKEDSSYHPRNMLQSLQCRGQCFRTQTQKAIVRYIVCDHASARLNSRLYLDYLLLCYGRMDCDQQLLRRRQGSPSRVP